MATPKTWYNEIEKLQAKQQEALQGGGHDRLE